MAVTSKLQLFRVHDERSSISSVASTVTSSFTCDPLIKWLRPHAAPWATDQLNTNKWQRRRIQTAIAKGVVLRSPPVSKLRQSDPVRAAVPGEGTTDKSGALTGVDDVGESSKDTGAAVILYPPPGRLQWTVKRFILMCKLRLLDIFNPVTECGTDAQRLETMIKAHDRVIARIKKEFPTVWYLEVVAVHPTLQGRGIGKKVMTSVLEFARNESMVLECTRESNIGFYKRLGFKLVEEVELAEGGEAVKLWIMLRESSNSNNTS